MSTVPPPLPVRVPKAVARPVPPPPLPKMRHPLTPVVTWAAGVFVLAVGGVAFGALVLPMLRRPAPVPEPVAATGPEVASRPEVTVPAPVADESSQPIEMRPATKSPLSRKSFDLPAQPPQAAPGRAATTAARIDAAIDAKLAAANLPASPLAGDAEFVRRVTLDLTGRIPTAVRVKAFLADRSPLKRAKLIDELLDSPEYGKHFARIWADALVKRDFDSNRGLPTEAFQAWMAEQLNANKGWDKIVTEMVTSTGQEGKDGHAFFMSANMDNRQPSPPKLVGAVGNLFMGVQIQCAECHKHPYHDAWTMDDFWGMAAFFGHTQAKRGGAAKGKAAGPASFVEVEQSAAPKNKKGKAEGPAIKAGLAIRVPDPNDPRKTVRTAKGKFFEGKSPATGLKAPYRPVLASWLTALDNRYFAPAAVNRQWAHLFSRGIVHPIEEMGPTAKTDHPELLAELAADFAEAKYDLKHLFRAMANSRAYQRSSRPLPGNAADEKLFSRMPVKVMDAKVLVDSLGVATERTIRGGKAAAPAKGKGVRDAGDALVRYLDTKEYDDEAQEFSYGIPQLLRLMNTQLTAAGEDVGARLAKENGGDPAKTVEAIMLQTLNRVPTAAESERLVAYVRKQADPRKGYAGVFWVLLNSAEFLSVR